MRSALKQFVIERVLSDEEVLKKYTHGKCKMPSGKFEIMYKEELRQVTLHRILLLVVFLDKAKINNLIDSSPRLFNKNAKIKSSKEFLAILCRDYLHGIGSVFKHLGQVGVSVSYEQTCIDELDFSVSNLATDLRDGVIIGKLSESLSGEQGEHSVLATMRLPAVSRLQKVHNVQIALESLTSLGIENLETIHPNHIVDGHRPKVLKMIWETVCGFKLPSLLDVKRLRKEIYAIDRSNRSQGHGRRLTSAQLSNVDLCTDVCCLLLQWCEVVCSTYNLHVTDFSHSFANGKALCMLIHFYHPAMIDNEAVMSYVANQKETETSNNEIQTFLNNEEKVVKLAKEKLRDIGGIPYDMLPITNSKNIPDSRSIIICVSYLCSRLLESTHESLAAIVIQKLFRSKRERNDISITLTKVESKVAQHECREPVGQTLEKKCVKSHQNKEKDEVEFNIIEKKVSRNYTTDASTHLDKVGGVQGRINENATVNNDGKICINQTASNKSIDSESTAINDIDACTQLDKVGGVQGRINENSSLNNDEITSIDQNISNKSIESESTAPNDEQSEASSQPDYVDVVDNDEEKDSSVQKSLFDTCTDKEKVCRSSDYNTDVSTQLDKVGDVQGRINENATVNNDGMICINQTASNKSIDSESTAINDIDACTQLDKVGGVQGRINENSSLNNDEITSIDQNISNKSIESESTAPNDEQSEASSQPDYVDVVDNDEEKDSSVQKSLFDTCTDEEFGVNLTLRGNQSYFDCKRDQNMHSSDEQTPNDSYEDVKSVIANTSSATTMHHPKEFAFKVVISKENGLKEIQEKKPERSQPTLQNEGRNNLTEDLNLSINPSIFKSTTEREAITNNSESAQHDYPKVRRKEKNVGEQMIQKDETKILKEIAELRLLAKNTKKRMERKNSLTNSSTLSVGSSVDKGRSGIKQCRKEERPSTIEGHKPTLIETKVTIKSRDIHTEGRISRNPNVLINQDIHQTKEVRRTGDECVKGCSHDEKNRNKRENTEQKHRDTFVTPERKIPKRKKIQSRKSSPSESMSSSKRKNTPTSIVVLDKKTRKALTIVQTSRKLSEVLEAVKMLETTTRISYECCEALAATNAPYILYRFMHICNRSSPHIELLHQILLTLANVSKMTALIPGIITENSVEVLLDVLQMFRDKEIIFSFSATLLWRIVFTSEEMTVSFFFILLFILMIDNMYLLNHFISLTAHRLSADNVKTSNASKEFIH